MSHTRDQIDAMVDSYDEDFFIPEVESPSHNPREIKARPWMPKVGPVGKAVLGDRVSKFILLHGERGSHKTGIALHKVVLECHLNPNNLGIICSIVRGAATDGGAWEKLNSLVLPEWFDGIGLEFTEPRMDDQKNRYIHISNQFGGWSRIMLKSMPYGSAISGRIKGSEPGIFFFDEITETQSEEYFTKPIQQIRRPNVKPHQFIAAGNPPPEGEQHWCWRKFFVEPLAQRYPDAKALPLTFQEDEFGVYHVPLSDNLHWTEEQKRDYQKTLLVEAKSDPSAIDRLIKGLWTARPTGMGMFKQFFVPDIHVKGEAISGRGLLPLAGFPIMVSYDLGSVNSCVTFEQLIPLKDGRVILLIFDEVDHLGERILFKRLAWEAIKRMKYWRENAADPATGKRMKYGFQYIHVAGEDTINQWRPGEGSVDAWQFEKEYNSEAAGMGERNMRLLGCPKAAGSVAARVRMLQAKLYQEDIIVSATCINTRSMLMHLEIDPSEPDKPRKGKWIHKFDSVTYAPFKLEMNGQALVFQSQQTAPTLVSCGSGN